MSSVFGEFKYAIRTLCRNPAFSLVCILTLGLATGANGALFSLVDAALLKPLPFEEADKIVEIWDSSPDTALGEKSRVSSFNYHHWRAQADAFSAMALYGSATFSLVGGDGAIQVSGTGVSEDYFEVLGVGAQLGRVISRQDFRGAAEPVAVLSHALWVNFFAADPSLVGSRVKLGQDHYTVVGVLRPHIMPVEAKLGGRVEFFRGEHVWVAMNPVPNRRSNFVYGVLARVGPGKTVAEASRQMDLVARRLEMEFPDTNEGLGARVVPLPDEAMGMARRPLLALLGAVGLVLLLACVNMVNLTLVRADARSGELAVRTVLGAKRATLIRQFLLEGCSLSFAGGLLGLAVAAAGVQILPLLSPERIPRLDQATVDLRVAGVTLAAALLAGLVLGVLPALRAGRNDLQSQLREGRGREAGGAPRTRRLLLVGQMALAVALVTCAALLIKSFDRILSIDLGFAPSSEVLTLSLVHDPQRYDRLELLVGFYDRLFSEIRGLPGVESVAAAYDPPLETNWIGAFEIEGEPPPPPDVTWAAHFRTVTEGYFETLGVELVSGRLFGPGDTTDSRPGSVIVNRSFVAAYFPEKEPLGRRLSVYTTQWLWGEAIPRSFQIVGVVKDVRFAGVESAPAPAFYIPYRQTPQDRMTVFAKTRGDALSLIAPIRAKLREIDPGQPLASVSTMSRELANAVSQPRFGMMMFSGFAAAALLLALIGLWGLVSETIRRGRHEIGVRMAVGADAARIFGWTIRKGLAPVLVGMPLGLAGAAAGGRFLGSLLYQTSPLDPVVFAVVPLALVLIAALCCSLPAFRAARTDPASVLRSE